MQYPLYDIPKQILNKAQLLGACYVGYRKVSGRIGFETVPYLSSIHFFKEDKVTSVGYFCPDMHSRKLGEMSGSNFLTRRNEVNNEHFVLIPEEVNQ